MLRYTMYYCYLCSSCYLRTQNRLLSDYNFEPHTYSYSKHFVSIKAFKNEKEIMDA